MAISNIFVCLMCHGPWVTPSTCRCNDLHHEIELGVVLGKQARKVTEDEAMRCVGGYCLALDMTARFAQTINKKYRRELLTGNLTGISKMRQRRKAIPGLLQK